MGYYSAIKKDCFVDIQNDMDGSQRNYAKWK